MPLYIISFVFLGLRQHRSFANSSREEILDFLDVVSTQGQLEPAESFPSLEELNEDDEQVQGCHSQGKMSGK